MSDDPFDLRKTIDGLTGEAARRQIEELTGDTARRRMDDLIGETTRRQMEEMTGEAARRRMDELTGAAARRKIEGVMSAGAGASTEIDELAGAAARRAMAQILGTRRTEFFEKIVEEKPELRVALLEGDFYERFVAAIATVLELNDTRDLSPSTDRALRHILFANVITCLETYLSDALISTTKGDRVLMRRFVETFQRFEKQKFALSKVFSVYDNVDSMAIQAMAGLIYHELARIQGVYRDSLGVEFPENLAHLYRAVVLRHDIVHRNGKDKEGQIHEVSSEDVELLAAQVSDFVEEIHRQIEKIRGNRSSED